MRRFTGTIIASFVICALFAGDAHALGHRRRCCCAPAVACGLAASAPANPDPSAKTISAAAAAPPKEEWHSLFDGKSLGKWTPTDFGTQGKIEVKDGQIIIGEGDGCSGITWTGVPPKGEYEIRLQAMRVEGSDFFCGVTFPVNDTFCSFICGGWGGGVVGISSIDGEDASENDTTKYKKFDEKSGASAIRVQCAKIAFPLGSMTSKWSMNRSAIES